MNGFAAVLVLLGVFWTQASALDSYVLKDPNKGYVTGTMTIDNGRNIVDVHIRSGAQSSDSIFDYSRGYIATRLFSRHACFILEISKKDIPELQEIGRTAFEKKVLKEVYNRRNVWVQFQSAHSWFGDFKDWLRYGRPIERLCSGLPLYRLERVEPLRDPHGCAAAGIPGVLRLNICEKAK